jgi:CheY-like chemotaxis protein
MTQNISPWVLEFETPGMREPYQITFTKEVIVGRGGPGNSDKVDVDLAAFGAVEKGVSRQHVVVFADGDQLFVTDLKTANGTMLNDKRLDPSKKYHLATDDQLILGALKVQVRIIGAPTYEHVPRKQTTIERESAEKPGNGEMVLIVEDHIEVAQLFSMMLQRQGFLTQISRDANRAMRFLQSHSPDAVILDLMLPGVDGVEIARYIRRDSTMDDTPVIVVSANRDPDTEVEVIQAGADIFLSKPINANELGDVVAEFMKRRKLSKDKAASGVKLGDRDATKALDKESMSEMAGATPVRDDTVAIIVAGHTDRPFTITLRKPMTFGRAANGNPSTHVDLSRYGAADMGVSRVHMMMRHENGHFYVEDAGSLNGTYVNGQHIQPNQPFEIRSGQEVRCGQLSMYVYFLSDTQTGNLIENANTSPLSTQEISQVKEASVKPTGELNPDTQPKPPKSKSPTNGASDG